MPVITNKPLSIAKVVIDLDTVFARFNRIRWFRSRTGANGVYEAATGPAATSAQLRSGSAEPHALDGKTLSLKVDGVTIDVAFAGPDPTTTADVIAAIAAETALVVGSDDDGFLDGLGIVDRDSGVRRCSGARLRHRDRSAGPRRRPRDERGHARLPVHRRELVEGLLVQDPVRQQPLAG
jgi:hypothetical protein